MSKLYDNILELISKSDPNYYINDIQNSYDLRNLLLISTNTLISSKKVFPRNADVYNFLLKVFDFDFKKYILKNRVLMIGRTTKFIIELEDILEIENYLNKINRFVLRSLDENEKNYLDNLRNI